MTVSKFRFHTTNGDDDMLISNRDGTVTCGLADVIMIYHYVERDTYHPALYEEHPLPGPVQPIESQDILRLMSKMHYTTGFPTLQEAQDYIRQEMQSIFTGLTDRNIMFDPIPWSGMTGDVIVVANWLQVGSTVTSFKDAYQQLET